MAILSRYYCIPTVNNEGNIVDFNWANTRDSFNFKTEIIGQTADNNNNGNIAGSVDAEIMVPLKYLIKFWKTLEVPLINFEFEIILTWSSGCVIIYSNIDD